MNRQTLVSISLFACAVLFLGISAQHSFAASQTIDPDSKVCKKIEAYCTNELRRQTRTEKRLAKLGIVRELESPIHCQLHEELCIPPAEPVCGNGICEEGEADTVIDGGGCGSNSSGLCLGPPTNIIAGTCRQDCFTIQEPPANCPEVILQEPPANCGYNWTVGYDGCPRAILNCVEEPHPEQAE